ncbi:MAG TPA: hypothetical protein VF841_09760 [Anaeromyxobacter sp.]
MMMPDAERARSRFRPLVVWGSVSERQLEAAEASAAVRGLRVEAVLLRDHRVPKRALLRALSEHTGLPSIEYDERMPVPAELLARVDGAKLSASRWVPVIADGDEVVVATSDPANPAVAEEVKAAFPGRRCTFRIALDEDVGFYIEEFLHAPPGLLIGTERTGLAYWRNTMALWRTRLACYRTDYAKAKTHLALLRWGLGLVGLSDALMHARGATVRSPFCWALIALGASFSAWAIRGYLRVRRAKIEPPGHHTLVEVTAATISFLERYHVLPDPPPIETKRTMLARLGDLITPYCTILVPIPASRERTHLARERNSLAVQRTIAACHRTLYARSRTGLALVRTGVAVTSFGVGLIQYFAPSVLTLVEATLVALGLLMVIDGALWHLPVRDEVPEVPRCAVL